jgi:hypothetical protein
LKTHAYYLIGEVEVGGLEASTAAFEAAFRSKQSVR